jgi:hypothetical protein
MNEKKLDEKKLETQQPNQQQPAEKNPYSAPEITKIDLNIKNWNGYIAASTCCNASQFAGY